MQSKWASAQCALCHPDKENALSYSGISKPHSASQQIHNKISRAVALPLSAVYYVCLSLYPLSIRHALSLAFSGNPRLNGVPL